MGRYRLRVGPGRYELLAPDYTGREELTIGAEGDVVRDFRFAASAQNRPLGGLAIEETPAGDRAIAGAVVEAALASAAPRAREPGGRRR